MAFEEKNWLSDFSPKRIAGFVVALVVSLGAFSFIQADDQKTLETAARIATMDVSKQWREHLTEKRDAEPEKYTNPKWSLTYNGEYSLRKQVKDGISSDLVRFARPADLGTSGEVTVSAVKDGKTLTVKIETEATGEPVSFSKSVRLAGFEGVLPPLLAILIALFFRRLVLALLGAVFTGATMMTLNPVTGVWKGLKDYIYGSVADSFSLYILFFTLALVGMVQVITRMGGIAGLLERFRGLANSKRSTRITTAGLGLGIFFDDYANTVVVGTSMRPITDQHKISREKLAYLVDSMSAPIAGIAIISTWIGYEVGLFGDLSEQLGLGMKGYDIFLSSLGFRFYCLFTIVFVVINAVSGRDFGPMLAAERRAAKGEVLRADSTPLTSAMFARIGPKKGISLRWFNAVIPVTIVIISTMLGMVWSGWSLGDVSIPAITGGLGPVIEGWQAAAPTLGDWTVWRESFSNADGAKVLFWAAMIGSFTALFLATSQRLLTPKEATMTYLGAVPAMRLAIVILILAWSIRAVCDDVGTSIYLVAAVQDLLTPTLIPLVTFLLAAVIALATGTSWGTMGILLPAMIPVAFFMTVGDPNADLILFLCFAAVLDGSIFGDHCSPISDTTVMSSISSSCDHLDHVRTQLPYAVSTMVFAAGLGYVGLAFGLPLWVAYTGAVIGIVVLLFTVGKPSEIK